MSLFILALAAVGILADANLIWGAIAQSQPGRFHLAILVAILTIATLVLANFRNRGWPLRAGAIALSLLLFIGVGILAAGYEHVWPLLLAGHGMTVTPPAGGFWYRVTGLLLLPFSIWGLTTMKHLSQAEVQE